MVIRVGRSDVTRHELVDGTAGMLPTLSDGPEGSASRKIIEELTTMSGEPLTATIDKSRARPIRSRASYLVGATGAAFLAGAILLGQHLRGRGGPTIFDSWALGRIGPHYHSVELRAVAELGGVVSVAVVLMLGLALVVHGYRRAAVAAVAGPACAFLLGEIVLKPWVARHIGSGLSYPSGHVTGISAVAADVSLVARRRRTRFAAVVAGLVATAAVAIAVIALGWHFPTDAIGGALVGWGSVLVVFVVMGAREAPRHERGRATLPGARRDRWRALRKAGADDPPRRAPDGVPSAS